METIPINPDVLSWAIDESGRSADELAQRLKVESSVVREWLDGVRRPSQGEWTRLAEQLRRPRSVFLFPEAPAPTVAPALRTSVGRRSHELDPTELLQVRRATRLQRQVAELRRATGFEVAVPTAAADEPTTAVARRLRRWLGVTVAEQLAWESSKVALGGWRNALEDRGLLVLQLRLGSGGVRGFSLLDEVAPVVAVNTAETNEARIFTMVHELAHLATGEEASCALAPIGRETDWKTERWCDRVSASVLLPADDVRVVVDEIWSRLHPPDGELALAQLVARRFTTSLRSSALRLQELGLAHDDLYDRIEEAYPGWDRDKQSGGSGNGERAPELRVRELGATTVADLLTAMRDRRITEGTVRDLLRLDGAQLQTLEAGLRESDA